MLIGLYVLGSVYLVGFITLLLFALLKPGYYAPDTTYEKCSGLLVFTAAATLFSAFRLEDLRLAILWLVLLILEYAVLEIAIRKTKRIRLRAFTG